MHRHTLQKRASFFLILPFKTAMLKRKIHIKKHKHDQPTHEICWCQTLESNWYSELYRHVVSVVTYHSSTYYHLYNLMNIPFKFQLTIFFFLVIYCNHGAWCFTIEQILHIRRKTCSSLCSLEYIASYFISLYCTR